MKRFYFISLFLICLGCNTKEKPKQLEENYNVEFEQYKKSIRKDRVKYLQLTGLFKLNKGINSFGKNKNNNHVIAIETLPETIGSYIYENDSLNFEASKAIIISTALDSTITQMKVALDDYGNSEKLYHDRLNWQLITRGNAPYLRVWDSQNPFVEAFNGFSIFDLNPNFIFNAQFTYFNTEKTEDVKSQLGINASTKFIGKVSFNYNDKDYTLDVGNNGFTMVSDATTGSDTYGGGRYVYLELPETDGEVTLDFNRLYNPPCSFSKYTTCLYPPRQNNLPFEILAGETNKRN